MTINVRQLGADNLDDFYRLHSEACGADWCYCVAWWVPTWDGWHKRSAQQNRALRGKLFNRGEWDLYLAYDGERPVASCQVGPRDRLVKLVRQFALPPDPGCWAVTCFLVAPGDRRRGRARALLDGVLADLADRGVERVEAYPRPGAALAEGDAWTGPEALYSATGFQRVRDGVVGLRLSGRMSR